MARRRRVIAAHRADRVGISDAALARALLQSPDFQKVLEQLTAQLRRELLQQLVLRPLQSSGAALGGAVRDELFGAAAERFALSENQLGALLHELLAAGESLL